MRSYLTEISRKYSGVLPYPTARASKAHRPTPTLPTPEVDKRMVGIFTEKSARNLLEQIKRQAAKKATDTTGIDDDIRHLLVTVRHTPRAEEHARRGVFFSRFLVGLVGFY